METKTNDPSGAPLRRTLGNLYRLILILSILLILLITGGRVFAASQEEFVKELTRGLAMQSGVVYATHSAPPTQIGGGDEESPLPTPTPGPVPSPAPEPVDDADYVASLAGKPVPESLDDAATRSPQTMSRDEIAWMAANFAQLSQAQLVNLRPLLAGSAYEERLWAAEFFAPAQAAIMANPASTAYGNFGPYSSVYASLVGGSDGGNPVGLIALQPLQTSTLSPASANFIRSNFTPAKWLEVLSFPLSTSQHDNIYAILTNPAGSWNAAVTPEIRDALLLQLSQKAPSF